MVYALLLIAILLPIANSYILLLLVFRHIKRRPADSAWLLFLSPGIGYALESVLFFVWSILFSPTERPWVIFGAELLLFVLLMFLAIKVPKQIQSTPNSARVDYTGYQKLLVFLSSLVFFIILLNFLGEWKSDAFDNPYGDWDAWAIWNLRAGFIASGEHWKDGFTQVLAWSHPDYPLLLPLNVARVWVLLGERSVFVAMILGLLFQLALIGLLAVSINNYRGYLQGILGALPGMVILFESLEFSQYADIPVAYYFLAATVLLYAGGQVKKPDPVYPFLTGLMIGAALWTKNEGWAYFLAFIVGKLLVDATHKKEFRLLVRWWAYFLLGILPLLLSVVFFKIRLSPPNDLIAVQSFGAIKSKLVDSTRYVTIIKLTFRELSQYGNLVIPLILLLPGYALLAGINIPKSEKSVSALLLFIIFIWILCYFFIYLITPQRLAWHINTSASRLISQVFPSVLFIYFMLVKPPLVGIFANGDTGG